MVLLSHHQHSDLCKLVPHGRKMAAITLTQCPKARRSEEDITFPHAPFEEYGSFHLYLLLCHKHAMRSFLSQPLARRMELLS